MSSARDASFLPTMSASSGLSFLGAVSPPPGMVWRLSLDLDRLESSLLVGALESE